MTAWERVPQRIRDWVGLISLVVALVVGAFGIGAATTDTAREIRELPYRVKAIEARQDTMDTALRSLGQDVTEVRCIVRAQALDEDPRDCLPIFADQGR